MMSEPHNPLRYWFLVVSAAMFFIASAIMAFHADTRSGSVDMLMLGLLHVILLRLEPMK